MGSKISAMSSEIKDLLEHIRKLEANVAALKNVNEKLMKRITDNQRQCWANAQYSQCECLQVVCIPSSVGETVLEDKVCQVFDVDERDMQSCHPLKEDKYRTIVKFSNMKDSLQIVQKKKQLCDIEPAVLDLPSDTKFFINESLCPYYRGIWNKCKKLRWRHLIHQYYTVSGTVRVKIEENGFAKSITQMVDWGRLFPEVAIESL